MSLISPVIRVAPGHLLGAAMVHDPTARLNDSTRARIRCASFVSTDDGRTWETHLFEIVECFDPWLSITPDGHAVFKNHLAVALDLKACELGQRTMFTTAAGLITALSKALYYNRLEERLNSRPSRSC